MSLQIDRRSFLSGAMTALGAAIYGVAAVTPRLLPAAARQSAPSRVQPAKARPLKSWVWLRMFRVGGAFPIPSSEEAYMAHLDQIDVAMPTNGGKLQADGTWLQESIKTDSEWARALKDIAHGAGQQYIPVVNNDREGVLTMLENPALYDAATDELLELALHSRYDAPWDGVLLDIESVPPPYSENLRAFYLTLVERVKAEGLPVGISAAGRISDFGTHDFELMGDIADFVDLRCYGYTEPKPKSIAPYWWLEASIQFALKSGIAPDRLVLGLGNFSKYWPDSTKYDFVEMTYDEAMDLVSSFGAEIQWIERNINGRIREHYADIGTEGHIWIHSWLTHKYGLSLVDEYDLLGTSLFAPGMGDEKHWDEIAHWRTSGGSLSGGSTRRTAFLALIEEILGTHAYQLDSN